jgi:tetratricopeptide (TPR) repeat protein
MASPSPRAGKALRSVPLAIIWLCALWPVALWLVHRADPVLAVRIARDTSHALTVALASVLAIAVVLGLFFPPAPAWVRRSCSRVWRSLTMDSLPLLKAQSELQHFETAARHAEIGRMLRLRRRNEQAVFHFVRAVELDAGIASAWHQLGLILFSQRDWPRAANAFLRAETLDPGHAFGDALLHHGRALHELGDAHALDVLREHQRRHGGGPRSHLWLADALLRAGERDAAIAALRVAAAPPSQRLSADENWFRALARVRLWGKGGGA